MSSLSTTPITLSVLSFSQESFKTTLDAREQEFVLLLAQVNNDLRYLRTVLQRELNELPYASIGTELDMVIHQYSFAIRIWYGLLNEAWPVIAEYWHGLKLTKPKPGEEGPSQWVETLRSCLANTFSLDDDGREAADSIRSYFTNPKNLSRFVRNKFAFHYDADQIRKAHDQIDGEEVQSFTTGPYSGNVFYNFAERVRYIALVNSVKVPDAIAAGETVYEKALEPYRYVIDFSRSVLPLILSKCCPSHSEIESGLVTDLTKARGIVFVDEQANLSYVRENRV